MVAMVQVGPEETQYNTAGAQVPSGNYFVQVSGQNVYRLYIGHAYVVAQF